MAADGSRRARAHDVRACCGHYWRPRHALCSCVLPGECHLPTLGNKSMTTSRGDPSIMEEKRRRRAAHDRQSRANSRSGWSHRFAPPAAAPEVAIGLEVASSVTMASTALGPLGDQRVGRLIAAARPCGRAAAASAPSCRPYASVRWSHVRG